MSKVCRRMTLAGLAVMGAAVLLSGCAGASMDWASVGASAVDRACKSSSHCDLPCGRDSERPDCFGGNTP